MNIDQSRHDAASHPSGLPELSEDRIQTMEHRVFASIADDRRAKRARRGRWWIGGAAAASVVVIAAFIAPGVNNLVSGGAQSDSAYSVGEPELAPADGAAVDEGFVITDEGGGMSSAEESSRDASGAQLAEVDLNDGDRDIIASAAVTMTVDDVAESAQTITQSVQARDGYVESMNIGSSGASTGAETMDGMVYDSMPYPYPTEGGWISVRVPADELEGMLRELSAIGEITSSSVDRVDVTEQTVDLSARVEATQASVDRLISLMAEATDIADVIAAESALAERQSLLESYQQQLASLQGQVAMSTISVSLLPEQESVEADPAGFGDGLSAGWNGLVATLNGIVVALGFMLPWLVIIALLGGAFWLIRRAVRRRRSAGVAASASATTPRAEDSAD